MNRRREDEPSGRRTGAIDEPSGGRVEEPSGLRPRGQHQATDNTPRTRHTLPPTVASALLEAHRRTRASYRMVARAVGTDVAHYWRLTRGTRAPSRTLALRLIDVLWLSDDVAQELLDASVDWPARHGE